MNATHTLALAQPSATRSPAVILRTMIGIVRANLPDGIDDAYLDGFLARNQPQMLSILTSALERANPVVPTDVRHHRERALANLAAMQVLADHATNRQSVRLTNDERTSLEAYSGWGGVGLDKYRPRFPAGLDVDAAALIHEYYTPTEVADAVGDLVQHLMPSLPRAADGTVTALEPSAGIGRFIRSASPSGLAWTAVEYSPTSAAILGRLRPDVDLTVGPFEGWAAAHPAKRFSLVVANPPYGKRGDTVTLDPNRDYRLKDAYLYFLLRTADMLLPNGVGIYLIPRGFIDGATPFLASIRERVLLRHHLLASYRLPSNDPARGEAGNLFPGANIVVDLVVLRSRGGELAALDEGDRSIVEGRYYEEHPRHVLGKVVIKADETGRKARFGGYEIHGQFKGLPAWSERAPCSQCVVVDLADRAALDAPADELAAEPEEVDAARALGRRVEGYLAAADADHDKAGRLHRELLGSLRGWVTIHGTPARHAGVRAALRTSGGEDLRRFVQAFDGDAVLAAIANPPKAPPPPYTKSPVEIANWLYRQRGAVRLPEVVAEHRRLGGSIGARGVADTLLAAAWCLDGADAQDLVPERVYVTGYLWPKLDRAQDRADGGDAGARRQVDLLRAAIKPAAFADIEKIEPRQSWLPDEVITAWANDTLTGRYAASSRLRWAEGLLQVEGADYDALANTEAGRSNNGLSQELLAFLGWANHDATLFKPEVEETPDGDKESLDHARIRIADVYRKSFVTWLETHADETERIVQKYNRLFRGYVERAPEPREERAPARWRSVVLHKYQMDSANRLLDARRGLLALDVGLGKTFTGLYVLGKAREEGWAQRPVLLVPNSLVWKWKRDVAKVLPDYRAVVIGSTLYKGRNGRQRSRTDTSADRGTKWTAFRAGAYDLAIVAYSVLARTKMRPEPIERYVASLESIQRAVALRRRNLRRSQEGKKPRDLSERDQAILREGAKGWVAQKLELPKGQEFDEGVWWDDIGVDFLMVDESQNFKNLFLPEEREGGVPDYMGNPGEGSDRAWALDFRCASVRARSGGAGVVLLSATPAKNSPLELYNALQLVDPAIVGRAGITDPEHFIDRFCGFTTREAEDVTGKLKVRQACTAFVNLHELRDLLYSVADYKTAAEVGLKLPEPATHLVDVDLDAEAADKVAMAISEVESLDDDRRMAASRGNMDAVSAITMKIMGVKMRISMYGIHGRLPEVNRNDAGEKTRPQRPDTNPRVIEADPHSGKIDACVANVLARKGCGHIVFCDFIAPHLWLKAALVEAGMDGERIAILNAPMVPDTESRQQIAMQFNGIGSEGEPEYEAPRYDVVIANAVAYEGVDLQRRTCAIHHLDLPWEPATLQQRNGRAVRQGNTLAGIDLFYYLALGTGDKERLDKIRGKAAWMNALSDKNARETSNPAAQLGDDGWDEFVVRHSRDPAKARARLEEKREHAREEARARTESNLRRLVRAANDLYRSAERNDDTVAATAERAEAEGRLTIPRQADSKTFPWASFVDIVRSQPVIVADKGPMAFAGLTLQNTGGTLRFGRVQTYEGARIIGRNDGQSLTWRRTTGVEVAELPFVSADVATNYTPARGDERARVVGLAASQSWTRWGELALWLADDQWLSWWWPHIRPEINRLTGSYLPGVPCRTSRGTVLSASRQVADDAYVYPPDSAGYERFAAEAPHNPDITFADAEQVCRAWWGRGLPRDAFKKVRG